MLQCPHCKRPTPLAGQYCRQCGADLQALFALLRLPTDLYNQGNDARRAGDDDKALGLLAASVQLTDDPRASQALVEVLAAIRGQVPRPAAEPVRRRAGFLAMAAVLLLGTMLGAGWRELAGATTSRRGTIPADGTALGAAVQPALHPDVVTAPTAASLPRPGTAAGSPAATPTRAVVRHVVRRGETLWDLAATYLGDGTAWPRLAVEGSAQVEEPRRLRVGTALLIEIESYPSNPVQGK